MDRDELLKLVAALAKRSGSGKCRLSPNEVDQAPVERMRISVDNNGDTWVEFAEHAPADEDTWTVDD